MDVIIGTPSRYSKSKMISRNPPDKLSKGSYFLILQLTHDKELIAGSLIAERYEDLYVIRQVHVDENCRRIGCGQKMMEGIIEFLKPKKRDIILYVDPNNNIAISLYTKLGFKLIKKGSAFGDKYLLTQG